jgi:iron-sulfur cluster repair protein YtfE (RIC family)
MNDCLNCDGTSVTANCTVEATIAKSPVASAVFNAFGIDTCCGGRATIEEAAARAHIPASVLLAEIERAGMTNGRISAPPSCGCGGH